MADTPRYLTPPQYAQLLGVKSDKVIGWIRRGELGAIDVSTNPGTGRPRYRIPPQAIAAFEQRRSAAQPKPTRRKRRRTDGVISFIK